MDRDQITVYKSIFLTSVMPCAVNHFALPWYINTDESTDKDNSVFVLLALINWVTKKISL